MFKSDKIVIAGMVKRIEACLDNHHYALGVQVYALYKSIIKLEYINGILNSKLITYLFKSMFQSKHLAGGYLAINKSQLEKIPIRTIDFTNKSDVVMHDKMVSLVETMLELNKRLRETSNPADIEMTKRQIEATDNQIDQLVYRLYGLTDDEIRIVEDSFSDNKKK
jgi:hypothetical protein